MKPKRIKTLQDLADYVILAMISGMKPTDAVLMEHPIDYDTHGLVTPTFHAFTSTPEGMKNGEVQFIEIGYWTVPNE